MGGLAFFDPVHQAAQAVDAVGGSADSFGKLIADEAKKWEPIIKRSGAKLE